MWLKIIFGYLLMLLKYIVSMGIILFLIGLFYKPADLMFNAFLKLLLHGKFDAIMGLSKVSKGVCVFLVLVIVKGAFDDLVSEVIPSIVIARENKRINKSYKKSKSEFEGFDEMLKTVQRGL